ncbi:gamma-glutamylcyclotransferase family protein [Streptomyces cinereospinus]|uniref:Gamma-glutamylcyclotransferase family protein n=1 Tax=Streptomyces cinereospinus TaxID=285561 RepID=A0ABV5N9G7_9ACTN
MTLPFFVYGTLRPGGRYHDALLRGRTRAEAPARLAGAVLYEGPGYPFAVREPGGVVTGALITPLPDAYGELLADLDRLEEYVPGDARNLYERVSREVVRDTDGATLRAWVYVAAPAVEARLRAGGRIIPGGDWPARDRSRRGPGGVRPLRPGSPGAAPPPGAPRTP